MDVGSVECLLLVLVAADVTDAVEKCCMYKLLTDPGRPALSYEQCFD